MMRDLARSDPKSKLHESGEKMKISLIVVTCALAILSTMFAMSLPDPAQTMDKKLILKTVASVYDVDESLILNDVRSAAKSGGPLKEVEEWLALEAKAEAWVRFTNSVPVRPGQAKLIGLGLSGAAPPEIYGFAEDRAVASGGERISDQNLRLFVSMLDTSCDSKGVSPLRSDFLDYYRQPRARVIFVTPTEYGQLGYDMQVRRSGTNLNRCTAGVYGAWFTMSAIPTNAYMRLWTRINRRVGRELTNTLTYSATNYNQWVHADREFLVCDSITSLVKRTTVELIVGREEEVLSTTRLILEPQAGGSGRTSLSR